MAQNWRTILLTLSAATLLFASCSKKLSTDTPLPTNYYPSVIISSDNQILYAFDVTNKQMHWQLSFSYLPHYNNTDYTPSPVYYNGRVYMAAVNSDTLYKIDARTGVIVQTIVNPNGDSYRSVATPVVDGGWIYLACLNGNIYAMDTTGNLKWQFNTGFPIESSPTVYNNGQYPNAQVYTANTGGHVYAIDKINGPDAITGLPTWHYPNDGTIPTGKFVSSISIGDPYLYVGSISDSSMYCIYTKPYPTDPLGPDSSYYGRLRWKFKTKGNIYSSPAAYGGYCIFGSTDYYVYCLDTFIEPHDPVSPTFIPGVYWKTRTNSQIFSSPLARNEVIYIGSNDYNLYAINMINGGVKWTFATNGLIKSSPVAYGSSIFVGSYDKNLYAVDTMTGSLKWTVSTNGTIECSPVLDNLSATFGYNSQISGLVN